MKDTSNIHKNHRQRMREKYEKHGADLFETHQLLEMLLFHSMRQGDTNPTAHNLLNAHPKGAGGVTSSKELCDAEGIGEVSANLLRISQDASLRILCDTLKRDAFEDEFTLKMLQNYADLEFSNVCTDNVDVSTDEEKEALNKQNEEAKDFFAFMKESIGDEIHAVRFTNMLEKHPVCLSSEGAISVGMEKVLNRMPGAEANHVKAELVLELNLNHPLSGKLRQLYDSDKASLAAYSKILYAQARLISGLSLENPTEISTLICDLMLR